MNGIARGSTPPASTRTGSTAAQPTQSNSLQAPAITLPTGGGAIRGIDEKFQVNPATGSGALTMPIATSPTRQSFGPQLAFSYDSGSGSGPFGLGWNLSLPSITRKTDRGLPSYADGDESDVFILSGAEDLVPVLVEDGGMLLRHMQIRTVDRVPYLVRRYRPRIEGLFARIERWTDQETGETHWRSITRDNVTTLYGRTDESRIADPADPSRVFSWLMCESYDDRGNAIVYRYKAEDSSNVDLGAVHERNRSDLARSANRYIKRIQYGNRTPRQPGETLSARTDWMFEVIFDYGEGHLHYLDEGETEVRHAEFSLAEQQPWPARPDPISSYRAGFEVRTYRLCHRVLMVHHFPDELDTPDTLVRATHFAYDDSPINTVLTSVVQSGYLQQPDGTHQDHALPPLDFEYSRAEIQGEICTIDPASLENLPGGLAASQVQWVDLDGEGISGMLTEQGGGWFYKANLGDARFAPQERIAAMPSLGTSLGGAQLLDLAGDGQLDLVTLGGPAPGFYERTPDRTWTAHRAFTSVPIVDWADPNLRFVDLTGDGHADMLLTEDCALTWYPSLAEAGYGPGYRTSQRDDEERGPRLLFADATQSIYVADMSGDGLTDLVRIRNGSVCYWPNLGYGRFGTKVSMDRAPWFDAPDQFDQRRIHLGDVDGSGITDILYVEHDRIAVYFNEAGNGWTAAYRIDHLPHADNLSNVTVTDLLGSGTACLVWSSPLPGDARHVMRYVDLMGGQKPHLLVGVRNNLGAETRLQYAPSTRFYLADKAAGQPWITRLPFPVHVVERVETYDHVSRSRFVSRYSYHHGYFDGVEREFRGFGRVDQIDTEEFAALSHSDTFPTGANVEAASHVPPVLTRSWYHTGAYIEGARISRLFEQEYYREPDLTDAAFRDQLLSDTILPGGLSADEAREACRALKGAMLRQEVYALDGTDREPDPYTVTEQNFTIRTVQPQADTPHGVFLVHAHEAISYHYERNPTDPRTGHALTLAVDDYGNVLRAASIAYGRRQPDPSLTPSDQDQQARVWATVTENAYTNPIDEDDDYRTPLASETLTYELTSLALPPAQARFSWAEVDAAADDAARIEYHHAPEGSLQLRVLEQARTLYRRDDLAGPLALGELQPRALPFEHYQLAFTPAHLDLLFGDRITGAMLSDEGRYVQLDGSDAWWSPSGHAFLSPNETHDATQELAYAHAHFFLPLRFHDPFGQTATVEYDAHDLLAVRTTDALENSITARHSYRVLAPEQVTDPNGNRRAAAFDALGRVTGTATMGTGGAHEGDTLDGIAAQITPAQRDAFFADPRGPTATDLLGSATTRLIYDAGRFLRLGQPAYTATILRETHASNLGDGETTAIQVSLTYSDGFGRGIQSKVQAEPGPVEAGGAAVNPRWATNGWTIFNNKDSPVKQYEPFFSADHAFAFGVTVGVSATLLYDPVGRVRATLHPDHTWEKVIFDPWEQETWDANDTVLVDDPAADPDVGGYFARLDGADYLPTWHQARADGDLGAAEQDAAQKAAAHANTPTSAYFDSLGRPFLSVADNEPDGQVATRTEQDIEGMPLRILDDRGNVVMAYYLDAGGGVTVTGYDVAGRQLYERSMDAGEDRTLPDIGGKPVRHWDSRGTVFRPAYDELQRQTHLYVRRGDEPEWLAELTVYGEQHPDAESLNLRGQVYRSYDASGVVTSARYDFKGNLLEGEQQLTRAYRAVADWSALDGITGIDALEAAAAPLLESEVFATQTRYDALDRPVAITTPDGSITLPGYNEASLLDRMAVRLRGADAATSFVENVDYDARGQRERIVFAAADGANVATTYTYDPNTLRLVRLQTIRQREGRVLQDLTYTYDPVGNIAAIRDDAQQIAFFDNVLVEPHASYTYDALYRLIRAEGREHAAQNNFQRDATPLDPTTGIPFPNSPEALQRYAETYTYDSVGNLLSLRHVGGSAERWTRRYRVAADSNRLQATSVPGDGAGAFSAPYTYDARGNMTSMPHLPIMRWDFKDRLQATSRQAIGSDGIPETTYYVYDASGERVRKVTERQAAAGQTPTRRRERIYLGGFEVNREYTSDGSTVALARETLHVMDGVARVALVETRTVGDDGLPAQTLRFQLGNHLGSASLELDAQGAVISYEEYHPYGTSAYRAGRSAAEVSLKRYRYLGKERDEETALYYYGARYYACWLGRWISTDPIGIGDGVNLYRYVGNNPIVKIDRTGRAQSWWDKFVDLEESAVTGLAEAGEAATTFTGEAADYVESGLNTAVEGGVSLGVEGAAAVYETFGGDHVSEETKASIQAPVANLGKLAVSGPSGAIRVAGDIAGGVLEAPKGLDRAVQTTAHGVETGNTERIVAGAGEIVEHASTIALTIEGGFRAPKIFSKGKLPKPHGNPGRTPPKPHVNPGRTPPKPTKPKLSKKAPVTKPELTASTAENKVDPTRLDEAQAQLRQMLEGLGFSPKEAVRIAKESRASLATMEAGPVRPVVDKGRPLGRPIKSTGNPDSLRARRINAGQRHQSGQGRHEDY